MFDVLAQNNIAVKMVSTSEIKVSVVIDEDDMILAVEMLHQAFELSESVSNVSCPTAWIDRFSNKNCKASLDQPGV